ncbi:GNAT family N-acetyltransferase [Chitinophaga sp. G-6-1-13]|uniref:GNAT family N-acetyltransferase n=1 Tax=Chitinophaga fulva TaxID=2728842 RepID=A0A848GM69_9BACT|nr:GNAT family N-acetyltransferase [Chitinophaga fulva]NML39486.1 GNAT family N-acetyltransferase [Chitinophaga fulva]
MESIPLTLETTDEQLLDNPVWNALTTVQAPLAEGTPHTKRYRREILSFIACDHTAAHQLEDLQPWINEGESFYLVGELPPLPVNWQIVLELPCAQMVLREMVELPAKTPVEISVLTAADRADMYDLVNRVQPGYYNLDTPLLGTYYGIRQEGRLVAMAGERMRMAGFTELSAIVTDPACTGKGYAQQLITRLCQQHVAEGITSMLHVSVANERAIRLYEHMGFVTRREIVFRKITQS